MLITTRRKGDTVDLYIPGVGRVRIKLMDVEDGKVRIAIDAPSIVEIKQNERPGRNHGRPLRGKERDG